MGAGVSTLAQRRRRVGGDGVGLSGGVGRWIDWNVELVDCDARGFKFPFVYWVGDGLRLVGNAVRRDIG